MEVKLRLMLFFSFWQAITAQIDTTNMNLGNNLISNPDFKQQPVSSTMAG